MLLLQCLKIVECSRCELNPFFQERDQEIEALSAALDTRRETDSVPVPVPQGDSEGPRRSRRITSNSEANRLRSELDQCRAELLTKTHGKSQGD